MVRDIHELFGASAVVAAVIAISTGPTLGATSFRSGNDLHEACIDENLKFRQGVCDGYIEGIVDVMLGGSTVNGFSACPPHQATVGLGLDIAKQYLLVHPERRHLSAAGLVAQALAEAFPCR